MNIYSNNEEKKKVILIDEFSPRIYQQTIFSSCISKNSLVVLPTGLGKTIIALLLSVYYFNKTNKKILFLAPTKPLVEQHKISFEKFIKNKNEFSFVILTGKIQPKKRILLYKNSEFIFSTPQVIENDLISNHLNPEDFSLVIYDEAHRATGNYSYVYIQKCFNKYNVKNLALTASPGSEIDKINEIINNLNIEHIEVRTEEDADVKPYVHKKEIIEIKVKFSKEFKCINDLLKKLIKIKRDELLNISKNYDEFNKLTTKKDILELMAILRAEIAKNNIEQDLWRGILLGSLLMKLFHLQELFETQEIIVFYNYINQLHRESNKVKSSQELLKESLFLEIINKVKYLYQNKVKHPKLLKLKEIVYNEFSKNESLKIIIFTQYRDTANIIYNELNDLKEIRPVIFVGQAKKNGGGLSQKKQKEIMNNFREDKYNVLISTSIGEEGLDIPNVDVVIFYEPIPSAIRTIQRIGRTGRFSKGRIYFLITEGTRDSAYKFLSKKKEIAMNRVLKDLVAKNNLLKDSVEGNPPNNENSNNLLNYLNKNEINNNLCIYVDSREDNNFKKKLIEKDIIIKQKKLDIGDIIINEFICIERKTAKDFVNSIIDGRLFDQLSRLSLFYQKPLLILENYNNIYTIKNIPKKSIDSAILTIMLEFRIPIIFSKNIEETAYFIFSIVQKYNSSKPHTLKSSVKKFVSEKEALENFLSGIPNINLSTSKILLNKFGSIKNIVNLDSEQLKNVEGIGDKKSKNLYDFFNKDYKNL